MRYPAERVSVPKEAGSVLRARMEGAHDKLPEVRAGGAAGTWGHGRPWHLMAPAPAGGQAAMGRKSRLLLEVSQPLSARLTGAPTQRIVKLKT